jgi:hypothetical protein
VNKKKFTGKKFTNGKKKLRFRPVLRIILENWPKRLFLTEANKKVRNGTKPTENGR